MSSYSCPFCQNTYSRHDARKRHAVRCSKRQSRPLPCLDVTRGRRRHACGRCARKKVYCDGLSPCTTCAVRRVPCENSRQETGGTGPTDEETGQSHRQVQEARSLGPHLTAFILQNCDEDIFSLFKFPKPVRRASDTRSSSDRSGGVFLENGNPLELPEDDTWLWAGQDFDMFNAFLSYETIAGDGIGGDAVYDFTSPDEDPFGVLQESKRLDDLAQTIISTVKVSDLAEEHVENALNTLRYLFSPAQAIQSLMLYFDTWHRNCRIIHRPSFSTQSTSDELLISMIMLGAMYNPREEERERAAGVIDIVDEYICHQLTQSLDDLLETITEANNMSALGADIHRFHLLQASFLVVVTQYWTGSIESKRKAATAHFDVVTKAARQQGLLSASHTQEDRRSQPDWLLNERRIRTSVWITLLDCAFLFFWGRPLRIASSEIQCDLPCEELVFDEQDPFTHPRFSFRRSQSSGMAFRALFSGKGPPAQESDLTVLDTFILLHLLYRFASDSLTLQMCLMEEPSNTLPYNDMALDLNLALINWHRLWAHLKSEAIESLSWEGLGFYKYGDQFEYAIRLLVSARARPYLRGLLQVNCDRLERLKAIQSSVPNG